MSHPEATHSHQNHVSGVTAAETHQNKPGGQMSDHIETRMSAAEVLAQHQVSTSWRATHDGWTGCTCDPDVPCDAQHQLAALNAARIAIVELPEPYRDGAEPEWADGDVWAQPGSGRVRIYVQDSRFEAGEAREFAADILAAADAAVGARITVEEA